MRLRLEEAGTNGDHQIEHFKGFPESFWEQVFSLAGVTRPASGLGDQFTFDVVNRNGDASVEQTFLTESQTKRLNCLRKQPSLCQILMLGLQVFEDELQRLVFAFGVLLLDWLDWLGRLALRFS